MGIAIERIEVGSLSINPDAEGKERITGNYSLISNNNKVLAKQCFNGYNGIEISFSGETIKLLNEFHTSLKNDVNVTLGITKE